jgi:hypothetical protein
MKILETALHCSTCKPKKETYMCLLDKHPGEREIAGYNSSQDHPLSWAGGRLGLV